MFLRFCKVNLGFYEFFFSCLKAFRFEIWMDNLVIRSSPIQSNQQ